MSDYSVVADVSEALRELLWVEMSQDDQISPQIVGSQQAIDLRNPRDTAEGGTSGLSVWLYHVTENEFLKNQPNKRWIREEDGRRRHDIQRRPPMAVDLYYLVTPLTADSRGDHLLLGKAMQILYDNPTILLADPAGESSEELRVTWDRLNLEDLTRIWDALRERYRLSVCYRVRVTRIDSEREIRGARVIERVLREGEVAA